MFDLFFNQIKQMLYAISVIIFYNKDHPRANQVFHEPETTLEK